MIMFAMFGCRIEMDERVKTWVPAVPVSLAFGRTRNLETKHPSQRKEMKKYHQIRKLKWQNNISL